MWRCAVSLLVVSSASMAADIVPDDPDKGKEAYDKLSSERTSTIRTLLNVLDGAKAAREKYQEAKRVKLTADAEKQLLELGRLERQAHHETERERIAILMLGELRSAEAVGRLLDRIELAYDKFQTGATMLERPLVIRMLGVIGKPSSLGALEALGKDKSQERAKKYIDVITLVEGVELGQDMVRHGMEKEKDPAKKARLKDALEIFKEYRKPQ